MQLTMHTDYALRLMIYLAVRDGSSVPVQTVADAYGISANHLAKVAQTLTRFGYVRSIRGRSGGITLGKRPKAVNIGTLVREVESTLAVVECFEPDSSCPIQPACTLKRILQTALDAFLATLDRYTLEDLVRNPESLTTLLIAGSPPAFQQQLPDDAAESR